MAWQMYRVTLRLLSPLHIGYLKQGNLQRTRPYVTGRALWGALTARLTRNGGTNDYQTTGKQINDSLALSYFFPSTKQEEVTGFPWDDPDEFAWRYLNTYASTALDYSYNTALEGSLHETECIAHVTRNGEPVYLVGHLFERDACSLAWKDAFDRLQLGGERTYGWGRVRLEKLEKLQEPQCFWTGWQVYLGETRPILQANDGTSSCAYAHVRANGVQAHGTLEPLVGRETRNTNQHGETLSQAVICWQPGAQIQSKGTTLQIGCYGVWEASNTNTPTK